MEEKYLLESAPQAPPSTPQQPHIKNIAGNNAGDNLNDLQVKIVRNWHDSQPYKLIVCSGPFLGCFLTTLLTTLEEEHPRLYM